MKKMTLDEAFKPTSRTRTPEGYLCVKGIAARTGVYQYVSTELDLPGPARIVNVYRPPEEVFAPESMASYIDKDVTNDHPSDLVNSTTFREVSVGHVRGVERDGDNLVVDMIIKDQSAIDDIESGKAELSPGYTAEYVEQPGQAPDGTPYELVQRDIKINHNAVVDAARAGKVARIFDHKPKGIPTMATRKVFLDSKKSRSVILDEETATVVEDAVSGLMKTLDEANERADKAEAAKDEAEEKAEEAKKSTSDAAIGERVKLTLDTIASASKIVKNFDAKGLVSPLEIKRAALVQLKPTRDWAGKSEAYITAAFDSAEEDAKETTDEDDDESQATKDSLAGLAKDIKNRPKATTDGSDAYNKFLRGEK
ncbi:DUF2213 domain-containing protein [Pseudomonas juntendi]|uniref:DUF2213 domain-containing protein n=1 Tax=Pseudomonas juntendi TaxID=2666183 RepID=A0ABD4YFI7_9PSED|nr:DUF2213 domain-containing protein [Pseudomonas juntendi]MDH0758022.1 DUF2213 domain-containing protein [Pseudomonas juntendi]MDH1919522.1 DUF2213 domain-containing protein [Pseudomonas juntendi]